MLPLIERKGQLVQQTRVNLYRNVQKEEKGKVIISGFPLKDDRHTRIKDPYGFADGEFVGFMDDNTPVRVKQEPSYRFSNQPDRVWFRLDTVFINLNQTKILQVQQTIVAIAPTTFPLQRRPSLGFVLQKS